MSNVDDAFRRARGAEPYLPDGGFSAAVLALLPRPRELPLWVKNAVLMLATAFGSAVAVWQLPISHLLHSVTAYTLHPVALVVAALVAYLCSGAAVWLSERS